MRTLDDMVPPSRRREVEGSETSGQQPHYGRPERGRRSRFSLVTTLSALVVVGASIAALFYFSSAEVRITPNVLTASVQNSFTATPGSGDLPYVIIATQKIATQSVQSTGTQAVKRAASGTFSVFNTQSKTQQLIAGTRFATAAGLIFRIHSAISIPAGTSAKPGSVTVTAYADQAGDSYNIGPSSFTIPGLAGTAEASQVYAQSTGAMSGGASGNIPVVDPQTEAVARTALKAALVTDLQTAIQSQVPKGYVLIEGAATTTFDDTPISAADTTGMAALKEQGSITAVVFPSDALAKAIASSVTGLDYHGEPLTLAATTGLTLAPSNGLPGTDATSFAFTLSGTVPLIYQVDVTQIAAAVSGKTRAAAEVALTNFAQVKQALLVLRPFWRQSFPEDPTAIHVIVTGQ